MGEISTPAGTIVGLIIEPEKPKKQEPAVQEASEKKRGGRPSKKQ